MSNVERRISNVEGGNANVITLRQAQGGASTGSGRCSLPRYLVTLRHPSASFATDCCCHRFLHYVVTSSRHTRVPTERNVAAQGLPCGPGGTKGVSNVERRISNFERGNANVITPSRRHAITPIQNGKCQILAFPEECLLGARKECRMSNVEYRMW